MNLEDIRTKIDAIDKDLIRLLKARMDCSLEVANIKRAAGLPIYHPVREQEILNRVKDAGGEYGSYLTELYSLLMACSRELQHEKLSDADELFSLASSAKQDLTLCGNVACYGQKGAFTHIALSTAFEETHRTLNFCDTFEKVFSSVDLGEADFGFVPVENSSAGSVDEVYDLILKYKLFIVGAASMPICHNLLAVPNTKTEQIKVVYSHPQALSQCKDFLTKHGIEGRPFSNTAAAAEYVFNLNDPTVGAIGSVSCANSTGLSVLCHCIQSFANNQTRFIALSKHPIIPKDSNKISVVFSLSHTPGSLQKILTRFSLHGLNLTKLESRVGKHGDFETQFYLDFLGNVQNEKTLSLLSALKTEIPDFAFLGNYLEKQL